MYALFAATSLTLVLWWMWPASSMKSAWLDYWRIENISLHGEYPHVSSGELAPILNPILQESFWQLDLQQVQRQIKQLPWIDQVTAKRIWPAEVSITLVEKKPIARWNDTGLVDETGRVFFPPQLHDGVMPHLDKLVRIYADDPEVSADLIGAFIAIRQQLMPLGWEPYSLKLTAAGDFYIETLKGIQIWVGSQEASKRIEDFVLAYNARAEWFKTLQRVDLRYADGFAVSPPIP